MPASRTNELDPEACGLISAALRHVRDAETLLRSSSNSSASPEGAYYLAGFAPEMAQKATLAERELDRAIGHIGERGRKALELACALDPSALRYARELPAALQDWSTDVRYKKTVAIPLNQAEAIVQAARQFTDDIVVDLWAEGRFPAKVCPW